MPDYEPIPIGRKAAWNSLLEEAQKRGGDWYPDFSGENFVCADRGRSFLPAVAALRLEADRRVSVRVAKDAPRGCWDVSVDGNWYGGFRGTDSTMYGMSSWAAKSATQTMFEHKMPYDDCRDFVGQTVFADRDHLQLRQAELLSLLTQDRQSARLFYHSAVTAAAS